MRRLLLALLAAVAPLCGCMGEPLRELARERARADALAPAAPEAPIAPAAVPRAGEQLDYSIALAGLPVGTARLATSRSAGADEPSWRVEASGGTYALLDWIVSVRGFASARLDESGRSRTFWLMIDEDGERSERALRYDGAPALWYQPPGRDGFVSTLSHYAAPQDPLALLQALRRFEPGAPSRDVEIALTLRSWCYRVVWLGRADVAVAAGEFRDALLWRVEVHPYEKLDASGAQPPEVGELVGYYDVALSADERRLPLRVEREFGFGQVRLELAAASRDEAATSADAVASLAREPGER